MIVKIMNQTTSTGGSHALRTNAGSGISIPTTSAVSALRALRRLIRRNAIRISGICLLLCFICVLMGAHTAAAVCGMLGMLLAKPLFDGNDTSDETQKGGAL